MPEHGTRTMYVHYKCRCDACCRAEHEQYLKRSQGCVRQYSKWGDIEKRSKTERQRSYNIERYKVLGNNPIHWREVADAHGMRCAICGKQTNPDDTWVNDKGRKCFGRDYPTVDHIVPLKQGGTDTWDNVQLACKRCNSRKGAKVVVP